MTLTISPEFFAGVKDAKANNYPDASAPGKYIVRINYIKADKTTPGGDLEGRMYVGVNYTVLKVLETFGEGIPSHRVGDTCSHMIFRTGGSKYTPAYFKTDMKTLICALEPELDPDAMKEEEFVDLCMQLVADDCPVKGVVMGMNNGVSVAKSDQDEDGNPKPGVKIYAKANWTSPLTKEDIERELDAATIERFALLD